MLDCRILTCGLEAVGCIFHGELLVSRIETTVCTLVKRSLFIAASSLIMRVGSTLEFFGDIDSWILISSLNT
jgi:hypothetical protein